MERSVPIWMRKREEIIKELREGQVTVIPVGSQNDSYCFVAHCVLCPRAIYDEPKEVCELVRVGDSLNDNYRRPRYVHLNCYHQIMSVEFD